MAYIDIYVNDMAAGILDVARGRNIAAADKG